VRNKVIPYPFYSQDYSFSHYGISQGLSDANAGPILQDRQGFIWVGTSHGLNRFDGLRFKTYLHDASDPYSLSANSISCLFESQAGHLWVGTRGGGMSVYDPRLDRFTPILHNPGDSLSLPNNYINQIYEDQKGRIWVATDKGLFQLISDPARPEEAEFQSLSGLPVPHIMCIAEWPKGTYWLGTARGGVLKYDTQTQIFERFRFNRKDKASSRIPNNLIRSFFVDTLYAHQSLWIATFGGVGKVQLDSTGHFSFSRYRHNTQDSTSIPHYRITTIRRDHPKKLWFTSYEGLIRAEEKGAQLSFRRYLHDPAKPKGLKSDLIYESLIDIHGNLWLGTAQGLEMTPLKYAEQNIAAFHHQRLPLDHGQVPVQDIMAVFEDKDENVWLGTYGHGLLLRHKASGKDYYFTPDDQMPTSLSHTIVTGIFQDSEGIIWV
ncbi:MAG: two-component regulator propeller domain-containing protein, partial [Bacteroidota bacterium]